MLEWGAVIRASRILVPVNGNPTDDDAVALACEIASRGKPRCTPST